MITQEKQDRGSASNGLRTMYVQSSRAPTQKITFGALAGAITIVVVWVVNEFQILPGGVQVTSEIASAVTMILTFIISYVVPPSKRDRIVPRE